MMTVKQLRKALKKLPNHFEVHMDTASDWQHIDIDKVDVDSERKVVTLQSSGCSDDGDE